jgi:hypothetical protein
MVDGYDPKEVSAVKTMDWMTEIYYGSSQDSVEKEPISFFYDGE